VLPEHEKLEMPSVLEAKDLFERFKSNGGIPDSACYNAMIEGLSNANKARDAHILFEETRLKGCRINSKTCVVLFDALHKVETEVFIDYNSKAYKIFQPQTGKILIIRDVHFIEDENWC